jgi:hypothetical protein
MTPLNDQLHSQLRAHARGVHASAAAVELVIAHGHWLRRTDFLDRFVSIGTMFDDTTACIDWPTAVLTLDQHELPCSGSEARILRIAASLAEGVAVDLRDALTELDTTNSILVSEAVTRACGH